MNLPIENCSRFVVKVANGRILKCDHRCPQVKLLLQDQEIIADFFLLPLDDHEAILRIKWLMTLGDISWNFMQLIIKFYSKEKQVILHGKREGDVTMICTQQMERFCIKHVGAFLYNFSSKLKESQYNLKIQTYFLCLLNFQIYWMSRTTYLLLVGMIIV